MNLLLAAALLMQDKTPEEKDYSKGEAKGAETREGTEAQACRASCCPGAWF